MTLTPSDLALRAGRIGASLVPAIVGVSPWQGPLDAFLTLTGRATREDSPAMRHGHRWEASIVDAWCAETGKAVEYRGTVVHPLIDCLCATPDRVVLGESAVLECKLVGARQAHHWDEGVPDYVLVQVVVQMACTNAQRGYVAAFIGGTDFRHLTIDRDVELECAVTDAVRRFHVDHVIADSPPPVDDRTTAKALQALFPKSKGDVVEAPPEAAVVVAEYHDAKAKEKLAADRADAAKVILCAMIGEHDGIKLADGGRVMWKWREETRVEAYTRPGYRAFNVYEAKGKKTK